jgi:hypothetical protein
MLNRMLKQMWQHRAARTCATQGHVVPREATDRLRQAYLGGNFAPSAAYECSRCGEHGTTQYLPGTAVDRRRLVPFLNNGELR